MEPNKQLFGLIFGFGVIVFLWLKFRNPYSGKKDRREEERRSKIKERRLAKQGRRKQNQLKHESKLSERREERSERRIGAKTRRHKKRRKVDNTH